MTHAKRTTVPSEKNTNQLATTHPARPISHRLPTYRRADHVSGLPGEADVDAPAAQVVARLGEGVGERAKRAAGTEPVQQQQRHQLGAHHRAAAGRV